jgi:hypothetical protein
MNDNDDLGATDGDRAIEACEFALRPLYWRLDALNKAVTKDRSLEAQRARVDKFLAIMDKIRRVMEQYRVSPETLLTRPQ